MVPLDGAREVRNLLVNCSYTIENKTEQRNLLLYDLRTGLPKNSR